MFCNKCGAKVTEGSLFCPSCGEKIDYEITPAADKAATSADDKAVENNEESVSIKTPDERAGKIKAHNFGVASLVLGIIGIFVPFFVPSILAIIFSSVSGKHSGGRKNGFAVAGIVLGWVSLATSIVVFILVIVLSVALVQACWPGVASLS